jgi:hypothetical protein
MDEAIEIKNPRAFKLRDSKTVNIAMVQAAEIMATLEEVSIAENLPLSELKNASLPAESLYILASAFTEMYSTLMDEKLIKSGSPISYQYTLH